MITPNPDDTPATRLLRNTSRNPASLPPVIFGSCGRLSASSDGEQCGATFRLELPTDAVVGAAEPAAEDYSLVPA